VNESPYTVADTVLQAVGDALNECDRDEVDRVFVSVGDPPWDDVCGQLAVWVERVYPSSTFPAEDGDLVRCEPPWIAVTLVVTLVRCLPVSGANGRPPAADVVNTAVQSFYGDAAVIWNRVAAGFGDWEFAAMGQTYLPPNGGGMAVETRVTVGVDSGSWCNDCGPVVS